LHFGLVDGFETASYRFKYSGFTIAFNENYFLIPICFASTSDINFFVF